MQNDREKLLSPRSLSTEAFSIHSVHFHVQWGVCIIHSWEPCTSPQIAGHSILATFSSPSSPRSSYASFNFCMLLRFLCASSAAFLLQERNVKLVSFRGIIRTFLVKRSRAACFPFSPARNIKIPGRRPRGASSMAVTSSRNRRPPNFHGRIEKQTEKEREGERIPQDAFPTFRYSNCDTDFAT